ncbi:hypothetical protein CLIB1423_34S00364 [[Candida] railenensis]|uniref:Hpc2-related domain-containing protein n=1 Tax=[Candida] railenensis TaxID=45579 RepID=A0A9P0W184_9ASCO|nr:hypothetical protein CLIB1423_34S00364 [[Candida] railenensis]
MSSSGRNFTISSLLDSNEDNNRRAAQNTSSQLSPKHLTVGGVDNGATIVGSRSPTPDIRAQFMATAAPSQPSFQRPILVQDENITKRKTVKGVNEIILVDDGPPAPGLGPPKRRTIKKKSPPAQSTLKSGSSLPMLVPKPSQSASPTPGLSFHSNPLTYKGSATPSTPGPNASGVNDQIRSFQTSFKLAPTPTPSSKTSINSIINVDDGPETLSPEKPISGTSNKNGTNSAVAEGTAAPGTSVEASATPAPVKKKRAPRKKKEQTDGPAQKKKKTEEVKKEATPANGSDKGAVQTPEPTASASGTVDSTSTSTAANTVPEPKVEPITATLTSEKNPKQEQVNLPPASIIELNGNTATAAAEVKKEEPPIIALNIPLLDPNNPKPGQSQVVINVLKLTEDKYGWNVMHPNAKSAIDLMDDMIDDEEDAADEEEEEAVVEKENIEGTSSSGPKKKKEEEELTEEQLVRQHEVKMNRKVGKYDYEDPFIDDEELQWEEEITSTKEGFFVYWGPLVDDRSSTGKKAGSKTKK